MGFFARPTFSQLDIDYLKEHKEKESITQLAGYMGKSFNAIKNKIIEIETGVAPGRVNSGKKTNIGKRPDLGIFARSSWEANVLRYLTYKGIKYVYEPKTFSFTDFGIKHGTTSYTPDVMVYVNETEYFWLEVKGFLKGVDKTKIRRFIKFFPEEGKKLKYISGSAKTKATLFFDKEKIERYALYNDLTKEYKKIIPLWE